MTVETKKGFAVKKFDLDQIDIRGEVSKYPFEDLEIGEGFLVLKPNSSVSSRVSSENKKGVRQYVSRQTIDPADGETEPGKGDGASKENPFTWVIRVKDARDLMAEARAEDEKRENADA